MILFYLCKNNTKEGLMEKNIIVCWNKVSANNIIEKAEKLRYDTKNEIDSILSKKSELKIEIETIIESNCEFDSSIISSTYKKLGKGTYDKELYTKINDAYGNITCGISKEEKARKLIEIIDKIESESKTAEADKLCLYNFCTCTSFDDLNKTLNKTSEINGFIVLCELDWSDYDTADALKGITLVQHFLRYEKKLKAPVIFTSFSEREDILVERPDANIILTPAVRHKFIQYSFNISALLHAFDDMKNLTKRQLDYTIKRFCDIKGLLSHIKHNVHGCSGEGLGVIKTQLLYAVKKTFSNDTEKLNKIKAASTDKEIEKICVQLLDDLQHKNEIENIKLIDFICDSEDKQMRTLILDDNPNDDCTNRLVTCMNRIHDKMSAKNYICSIARPMITRNVEEFFNELDRKNCTYNNIILDIEIWNKSGDLESLGFDIAEEVMMRMSTPVQINMITNITRSLHSRLIDSYNNDVIKGIYLKEEILSSDARAIKFIQNLNQEWNSFYSLYKTPQYDCCKTFQRLLSIAKRRMPNNVKYDIDFNKISDVGKTDIKTYTITNYDEFDIAVNDISTELIRRFLTECGHTTTDEITWPVFDTVCATMRKVIADDKSIGLGNEKLTDKVLSKGKEYKDTFYEPTSEDIINFVIKLALRRFFLYLKLFIHEYDILKKFNDIKKKDPKREDIKWSYKDADLACRAISEQYKGYLNTKFNLNNQSKGLTEVLLYTTKIDEKEQLSEEEKLFINAVMNNNNAFNYIKSAKNLTFEY